MNVFTKDLGIHQGRVKPARASDGSYAYELGHQLLQAGEVKVGDYHQVDQDFVVQVGALFLRAAITVVAPPVLPIGAAWEVSGWLNGAKMVSRRLRLSKRPIVLEDWRISLAAAHAPPTTNNLAFRLELVST